MEDLLGDTRTIDCQDLFKRSMICRPFVLYAAGTGLYPRLHRCDNVVGRTHCELELLRAPAPVAGLQSADRVIRIGVKVLDGNFFACLRRMFNAQLSCTPPEPDSTLVSIGVTMSSGEPIETRVESGSGGV